MIELLQELGLLARFIGGESLKTPPNLLLLFQWGVLFVMLVRIFLGWGRLEKLADTPDAPTGPDAAAHLQSVAQSWWRRGCIGVVLIYGIYVFWLVVMDGLMSETALYISGMWAISLWMLNSNIHRMKSITDIPSRGKWTLQVRNLSMSLVVFVIYGMFVQNLSAQFIAELRRAYYGF